MRLKGLFYDRPDAHGEDSRTDEKARTEQAAAVLDAKLRAAMEEAHIAGVNAFEEFMQTSRLVQDGIVYDTAGSAFVR